jgi:hypothetical protein
MGVREDIAAQNPELERLVDAPTGALGYGTDLACVSDLTPNLDEVDPNSVTAIGEAILRRWTCPRGRLLDDLDYGVDVRGFCNQGQTTAQLRELATKLAQEALKDDRVVDVQVTVTYAAPTLNIAATITPADPALDTFTLTFSVTSAEVLSVTIT